MTIDDDDVEFDGDIVLFRGQPLNGDVQEHYWNGTLKRESNYLNGFKEGCCREWHNNGSLSCEWHSKRGVIDGKKCEWHSNGNIKFLAFYSNGIEIICDEWDEHENHKSHREINRNSDLYKYAISILNKPPS